MTVILFLLVLALLLVSVTFNCLGTASLYRFPDVYTRMHGATKCTTFGTLFASFALLLYSFVRFMLSGESRFMVLFIHTAVAAIVLLISNPTGAHAMARAAHRAGFLPHPCLIDALEEAEKAKAKACRSNNVHSEPPAPAAISTTTTTTPSVLLSKTQTEGGVSA
ncbi:MAG: monovalent cation/H(+) antiporter subunit G [Synergistaceae bacterium]|jgi:multicomponent Na+:H+ antiporter subunit G|nr:monovalent cation/H(+) antiporter subunit G [Synergistaceae bacterium]